MSSNVQLLVNNVDLTQYLDQGGDSGFAWRISQQWSRQGDVATFYLWDEHPSVTEGGVSLHYSIAPVSTVVFKDVGLGLTLFSGIVSNPTLTRYGPNLVLWTLNCTDWTYMSDRSLVHMDVQNLTTDQMVIDAVNIANCGVKAATVANGGFVYPGPLVTRAKFIYNTLSSALTNIVQLAGTYTSWGWHIDENVNLHFYPLANAIGSGVTFTDVLTKQPSGLSPVSNTFGFYSGDPSTFSYNYDATQLRNLAVVRGANYSVKTTDTFIGNGSQSSWPLTQAPDTTAIQRINLKVGGVVQTVSAQQGTSATTQFVINPNLSGQWFLQVNGGFGSIPGSGTSIVISYSYVAPNIAQVTSAPSIAKFSSLPNRGVFQVYIADTNLQSLSAAQLRAQAEVRTFAFPEERVTFVTTDDWPGHIRGGETFTMTNSFVPDSQNNYSTSSPGFTDTFIVLQNQIQASAQGAGLRTYTITAARLLPTGGVY